jgi:hypothetical protein
MPLFLLMLLGLGLYLFETRVASTAPSPATSAGTALVTDTPSVQAAQVALTSWQQTAAASALAYTPGTGFGSATDPTFVAALVNFQKRHDAAGHTPTLRTDGVLDRNTYLALAGAVPGTPALAS